MTYRWILPLESELAGLTQVGGKGANLAQLARAGFPIPGGFLITTRAYHNYVAANELEEQIQAALAEVVEPDAERLEAASRRIREAFRTGQMQSKLADELGEAYRALGAPPVAVRSSANTEDLPDLSFAGQQDTYLNIQGEDALQRAVVNCWSSLWTERAISYRIRNLIDHHSTALAVVVQRMVESQVSGVLFTANPLSGHRGELVIDAAYGLGEALVSGQVEPDQYVVDVHRGEIVGKRLGTKILSLHTQEGGGTQRYEALRKDEQALPDDQILALARLGQQAAAHFGAPQDIEWAWADGQLSLLQSRPITSLYPLPKGIPPEPLRVFFSFGAVQGMLDPITPLGREMLTWVVTISARLFGIHYANNRDCPVKTAGERLWVDLTTLMRNHTGRRLAHAALSFVEPTIQQALNRVWDERGLQPQRRGIRPRALLQILRFFLPVMANIWRNLLAPERRRVYIVEQGERLLAEVRRRCSDLRGTPRQKLVQFRVALLDLEADIPHTFRLFLSGVATGMATYNFVRLLSKPIAAETGDQAWNDLLLELTRGLENNPTTQMDLDLWEIARAIQRDPALDAEFMRQDAGSLTHYYRSGAMSANGTALIDAFLARYGGRGLAEIDLGRARWREDPTHVFEMLTSYLQIERPEMVPDMVFQRGKANAQAALKELCDRLSRQRGGWLRVRLARFFAGRMRAWMGLREAPKFFAVRLLSELRWTLLAVGEEMVQDGELNQANDLIYLTWDELDALAVGRLDDLQAQVSSRREAYGRELRRKQIPRLLLSDGRAFYGGIVSVGDEKAGMRGSPVSPGCSEGYVRVVLNPQRASLKPGEILVCPGTDPSWTPLFLSAAGLIMEVGGMMTHGAVVAREYGIPAIVGVDQAATRLHTGQFIRMDGSSGMIEVLKTQAE